MYVYIKYISLILLCITVSGCSYFVKDNLKGLNEKKEYVKSGTIINDVSLSTGGKLLVLPFKAGKDVEANEELDKITMFIIRGVIEAFKENGKDSNLEIVFSEDNIRADFILEGFITGIIKPAKLSSWILRDKECSLFVEGKIYKKKSINPILIFSDTVKSKKASILDLGLSSGRNIGNFIIKGK